MHGALRLGIGMALLAGVAAPLDVQEAPVAYAIPNPLPDGPALPGDDKLSCAQVLAESRGRLKQLDEIEAAREAIVYRKGAKTKALEAAGMLGSMLPGPIGKAAAMASATAQMETTRADAKANYGDIDRKSDWVMDRTDLMNETYKQRCLAGQ